MIPAIIFYLIRKMKQIRREKLSGLNNPACFKLALIFCALAQSLDISSQETVRHYSILYKGEKIGKMQIMQTVSGDSLRYKMISDVKMRMIFRISVATSEEALFVHDRLISSTAQRHVNGSQKVNRQLVSVNDQYMMYNDGKKKTGNSEAIAYNFTRLYCLEPLNRTTVWSDAYHEFLPVKQVSAHRYKVTLPDGDYNYYSYHNGICNKVEIVHSFYTIQMVLN
jgi:hypothetical protein